MTKAHDPNQTTGAMIQEMCAAGIPQAQIASACGLSEPTLRKHYRHQLDHGGILANAKVAANLFRMATGEGREAVTAAIFWMKTRAGWRENNPAAQSDAPTEITITVRRVGSPVQLADEPAMPER